MATTLWSIDNFTGVTNGTNLNAVTPAVGSNNLTQAAAGVTIESELATPATADTSYATSETFGTANLEMGGVFFRTSGGAVTGGNMRFVLRLDSGSYVYARIEDITSNGVKLYKVVSGVGTTLLAQDDFTVSNSTDYTVILRANGTALEFEINSSVLLTGTLGGGEVATAGQAQWSWGADSVPNNWRGRSLFVNSLSTPANAAPILVASHIKRFF